MGNANEKESAPPSLIDQWKNQVDQSLMEEEENALLKAPATAKSGRLTPSSESAVDALLREVAAENSKEDQRKASATNGGGPVADVIDVMGVDADNEDGDEIECRKHQSLGRAKLQLAINAHREHQYEKAFSLYTAGLQHFTDAFGFASEVEKKKLRSLFDRYANAAEKCKKMIK